MEKQYLLGLGAFGLLVAASFALSRPTAVDPAPEASAAASARLTLAAVSADARRDIDYAALDARLKRLVQERAMVGMAVGIVEDGRITFLSGYGETLAGSGDQVTADTVFRWASVSKGVASSMVATLAEDGKLDLNAPLANYAAGLKLPAAAEFRATVGDLLSHRVGLYRNAYDNKLEEGHASPVLRRSLSQLNLICPPGTCWSYQNVAYDASSDIVAELTRKSYPRAVKERLFDPIGMASATMTRDGLVTAKSWARPHGGGRRPLEVEDSYYRVPAAGGVNSNIKDLALWLVAQTGAMPAVLSPRLLETIHAPLVKTPGERRRMRKFLERVDEPHYGYGWRSYDYAGHHVIGHHGGVDGYRALILFDPRLKSGVVAMWNSNTSQPNGLEFEVMDMLYDLPFRDWMELDMPKSGSPEPEEDPDDQGSEPVAAIAARVGPGRGTSGGGT